MTEVPMTCTRCDDEIPVDMDAAILRTDVDGELLTLLVLVGVEPLRLSEPTLPEDDRAPALAPLTWDDLLTWHQLLAAVRFVTPWER